MPQCVVSQTISTSSGDLDVLVPSVEPCAGALVLLPDEYARINNSPWNLTPEEGLQLSVAIVGVWAAAWACRALVRALGHDGEVNE